MAGILLAYAGGMCRVVLNNHRAYVRALELGVTNAELLVALSASEMELRISNRTLEDRVLSRTRTLERQSEALRQAQRMEVVGRLAGNLAHDFNSLLTVVINNAAQLESCPRLEEHERLAAEETLEAGRRGAALIRQLLAFSRRQRPEPRVFSLNDLTVEWSQLLPRVLGEGISVELELAPEVPLVLADPAYAEQALLNLVLGTRAAATRQGRLRLRTREAQPGSPHVELWLEHAPDEESTVVHAANAYLSFEADIRNETAGLPSVRATAAQWGGSVEMDEEPKIVRYRLLFPAGVVAGAPASTREARSRPRGYQATVLVVDDEPTLRSVMRRALARDGHEVLVAEDGARALKLAASHARRIDLLLTDVVMPGLSGLELARRLTRERPGIAVLYVSGFTFEEAMPSTDLSSGTAYLPKPFDAATLTHKVRELLRASHASREAASSR
jgi:CheY-like chemotaxis protein